MLDGQSVVTKRVSCDVFCGRIAVRLFLCISTPIDTTRRSDGTGRLVLVVDWDTGASKTDNLFCASPQGTAWCRIRTGLFGSGVRFAPPLRLLTISYANLRFAAIWLVGVLRVMSGYGMCAPGATWAQRRRFTLSRRRVRRFAQPGRCQVRT